MTARSRLLKVHHLPDDVSPVSFEFRDAREECDREVAGLRSEAERYLATAREEAETIRVKAHEEARQQGLDEAADRIERLVDERADDLVEQKIGSVVSALETAGERLDDLQQRLAESHEPLVVRLAVAIAGKLLRTRLQARPETVRGMVAVALGQAAGSEPVELRLHPDDLELLNQDDTASGMPGGLVLAADETIERGGCVVQLAQGEIDATLDTMLERIAAELLDADEAA